MNNCNPDNVPDICLDVNSLYEVTPLKLRELGNEDEIFLDTC